MKLGTKKTTVKYEVVYDKYSLTEEGRRLCYFDNLEEATKYAVEFNKSENDFDKRVHVEEIKVTRTIVVA